MRFLDRVRNGAVGMALRFGVEEGVGQVTRTRARQTSDDRETVGQGVSVRAEADVGLPSGETSMKQLAEESDRDEINGVSLAEMRYLAGVPNPFGEIQFDPTGLDFGGLEQFRQIRDEAVTWGRDAGARRAIVETATRGGGLPELDNRPRRYHANPDPRLDDYGDDSPRPTRHGRPFGR